jgi:hypothetical protein
MITSRTINTLVSKEKAYFAELPLEPPPPPKFVFSSGLYGTIMKNMHAR